MDADFAGLFEVKEDQVHVREGTERACGGSELRLSYRRGSGSRAVTVSAYSPRCWASRLSPQISQPVLRTSAHPSNLAGDGSAVPRTR